MISLHEIIRQYPVELQRPEFYDPMVKEYLHHHILKSLFNSKHSGHISFLGGTALRYFYNLRRFSEDLDFDCSNLSKDLFFEMTNLVNKELQASGFDVIIGDKKKHEELKAFRRVFVFPELKFQMGISQQREAKFFIKIEAEPHHYSYQADIKVLNGFGITTPIRIVPLEILFSSKIAAAVNRKKDRDFYDVVNLINFATPDFGYLLEKCKIGNPEQLKEALLSASVERNLDTRKIYDCSHMLFDKNDLQQLKTFHDYIKHFNFSKFQK